MKQALENENESWTYEKFKNEFFLCLTRVNTRKGKFLTDRDYYKQAIDIMYKIPVFIPSPPFIIRLSDLSERIRIEFNDYCALNKIDTVVIFLKEIATRFFENINFVYFHRSVMRSLKVRVE